MLNNLILQLSLTKPEQKILIWAVAVVTLFRLTALLPFGLVGEDYWLASWQLNGGVDFIHYVNEGRPIAGVIHKLLAIITGSNAHHAVLVFGVLANVALGLSGVYLGRLWKTGALLTLSITLFISFSPYIGAYYTHKYALFGFILYLFSILSLYFTSINKKYLPLSIILLYTAVLMNQLALIYAGIVVIFYMLFILFELITSDKILTVKQVIKECRLVEFAILFAVTVILYALLLAVTRDMQNIDKIPSKISVNYVTLKAIYNHIILSSTVDQVIFPKLIKYLLLLQLLLSGIFIFINHSINKSYRLLLFFSYIIVLGLSLVTVYSVILYVGPVYMINRVLVGYSVLWAGVFAFSFKIIDKKEFRIVSGAILSLAIFAFASSGALILSEFARQSTWDANLANRMLTRLEAIDGYKNINTVVHVGRKDHQGKISTRGAGLDNSAFATAWVSYPVFNINLGTNFVGASPYQQLLARSFCSTAPLWPESGSVGVIANVGIICYEKVHSDRLNTFLRDALFINPEGAYVSFSNGGKGLFMHPTAKYIGLALHPARHNVESMEFAVSINEGAAASCGDGGGDILFILEADGVEIDNTRVWHKTGAHSFSADVNNVSELVVKVDPNGNPGCDGTNIILNTVFK